MMKKTLLMCVLLPFCFCVERSDTVEMVMEEGINVVHNKLEPYVIKDEPASFFLEEDFVIDCERTDLAEQGLDEIRGFSVDSKGRIYCLCENGIFLFAEDGAFVRAIGKKGQGPGEFSYPWSWWISENDEFMLYDYVRKIMSYDGNGDCTLETRLPPDCQPGGSYGIRPLDASSYLSEERVTAPDAETIELQFIIRDTDFIERIRLPEKLVRENPFQSNRICRSVKYLKMQMTSESIYLANQENPEFEINIYAKDGTRTRTVRKEYSRVKIPQSFKDAEEKSFKASGPYRIHKWEPYFDEYFPAIQNLYVDDSGHILAETYERGEEEDEYLMDLFTREGVFVGRIPQKKAQQKIFTNGRLYALNEMESGFQKLVVSRVIWE